ncbi:helix-turn-helix domain-containing protein [Caulobacter henricii]|uniref:Crp/Fnr family transcriptional regulator n=1 Tax=Caulobacter henricii TaxID=69395 RepID=A0A0P0NXG5_9CAUL|nr:helix-turn-helix domain-containing protein [Caulobacter henricii]ALL12319.1 Crp/Fnr family transcriptional regulator [Caulobacter henricii]
MSMPAFLRDRAEAAAPVAQMIPTDEVFSAIGVSMSFSAGEEIYAQDDESDMVYQVQRGAVRASRLLGDGRRQIAGFYYAGDLFGLEAGPTHRASAEALCDSKILVTKRSSLKHYGEAGERLERLIWRATGQELGRAQDHMMLLARKSAYERVAGFLADVAKRQGSAWNELAMSRQDIADHLGLTIETVSRMVTQLQADGLVALEGCRRFRVAAPVRLADLVAA